MDKWISILIETEDKWHESTEYLCLPLDIDYNEYKLQRDLYKAQLIYETYGMEVCMRFIKQCPHLLPYINDYVPCIKEPHKYQCSMFCPKYDFERGCMKYANEQLD